MKGRARRIVSSSTPVWAHSVFRLGSQHAPRCGRLGRETRSGKNGGSLLNRRSNRTSTRVQHARRDRREIFDRVPHRPSRRWASRSRTSSAKRASVRGQGGSLASTYWQSASLHRMKSLPFSPNAVRRRSAIVTVSETTSQRNDFEGGRFTWAFSFPSLPRTGRETENEWPTESEDSGGWRERSCPPGSSAKRSSVYRKPGWERAGDSPNSPLQARKPPSSEHRLYRRNLPDCSPRTAGPQPRAVLRLALRPGGRRRKWGETPSEFPSARGLRPLRRDEAGRSRRPPGRRSQPRRGTVSRRTAA